MIAMFGIAETQGAISRTSGPSEIINPTPKDPIDFNHPAVYLHHETPQEIRGLHQRSLGVSGVFFTVLKGLINKRLDGIFYV
ncbi:MAG: hypothetical protein QF701_16295 [Nitrospinota bacterium]|nr:hypothetical protein [Nitrospinota bacterium]